MKLRSPGVMTLPLLTLLSGSGEVLSRRLPGPGGFPSAWHQHCAQYLHPPAKWRVQSLESGKLPRIQLPGSSSYETDFLEGVTKDSSLFDRVVEIIEYANQAFTRRGWPQEFLLERKAIAEEFAKNSDYGDILTKPSAGIRHRRGSVGITVVKPGGPGSGILPMEASAGWKIDLPLKIELRTYAMDPDHFVSVFPTLFSSLVRMVGKHINASSGLFKQKMLFTYGDEVSIRLYRMMGFELADPAKYPPITHKGVTWHVLRISPEDLLKNHQRIQGDHLLTDPTGPIVLTSIGNQRIRAKGEPGVWMQGSHVHAFRLAERTELGEGVWMPEGTEIRIHTNGRIIFFSSAEVPIEVAPGIHAASGSWVQLTHDGKLVGVQSLDQPAEILAGVRAAKGSGIWIDHDSDRFHVEISRLETETEIAPEIWAAPQSSVKLRIYADGTVEIVNISQLSRPYVVDGKLVRPAGSVYMPVAQPEAAFLFPWAR